MGLYSGCRVNSSERGGQNNSGLIMGRACHFKGFKLNPEGTKKPLMDLTKGVLLTKNHSGINVEGAK